MPESTANKKAGFRLLRRLHQKCQYQKQPRRICKNIYCRSEPKPVLFYQWLTFRGCQYRRNGKYEKNKSLICTFQQLAVHRVNIIPCNPAQKQRYPDCHEDKICNLNSIIINRNSCSLKTSAVSPANFAYATSILRFRKNLWDLSCNSLKSHTSICSCIHRARAKRLTSSNVSRINFFVIIFPPFFLFCLQYAKNSQKKKTGFLLSYGYPTIAQKIVASVNPNPVREMYSISS